MSRAALTILAILGLGCASTDVRSLGGAAEVGDRIAENRLEITHTQLTGDRRQTLGAFLGVRSVADQALDLEYIVRWFSADDREVRGGEPQWRSLHLEPRESGSISSTAPALWCTRFELDIKDRKEPLEAEISRVSAPGGGNILVRILVTFLSILF